MTFLRHYCSRRALVASPPPSTFFPEIRHAQRDDRTGSPFPAPRTSQDQPRRKSKLPKSRCVPPEATRRSSPGEGLAEPQSERVSFFFLSLTPFFCLFQVGRQRNAEESNFRGGSEESAFPSSRNARDAFLTGLPRHRARRCQGRFTV